jgi:Immunoglobulin I-set domain
MSFKFVRASRPFSLRIVADEEAYFTVPLQEIKTIEGQTVTLACEVSRANAEVTWLKDDAELQIDDHLELVKVDRARHLTIHEATLEDEAEYTVALSETVATKATLWVEGSDVKL